MALRPLLLLLALLPLLAEAGDRAFKIKNECAYTVWPALANYPTGTSTLYTGTKAWEAAAGSEQDIAIPAGWNGRIWARLDCTKNGEKLSCKFGGDLTSAWEPADMGMGNTNLFEINLTGDTDYWDISAVPGFGTGISVVPTDTSCGTATCTKDLNPDCPSVLAVQGDDGSNIGCLSACNAKINAVTPSYNCCSGTYDDRSLCTKDKIDYYDYFKDGCTHAYAYPFDDGTTDPTVVYACSQAKESGYTITFCPGGSDSSDDSETTTSTLAEAAPTSANNFVLLTDSTGTSSSGSATSSAESSSGHSTAVSTAAPSRVDQASSGGSGATAAGGTTAALSKTSSFAASPSTSSSDTAVDGTILGLSKTAFGAVVGGVVLIAVAGVLLCVCMGRKKQQAYAAPSSQGQAQAQTTTTVAASLAHRHSSPRSFRRAAPAAYEESSSEASSGEGEMNSSDEERELMREIRSTRSTGRSASRSGRV